MCGFAGFVDRNHRLVEPPATLRAMARAVAHRGPDGEGFFEDSRFRIGIAHRRLAILDRGEDDVPRSPRAVRDVALSPVQDPRVALFAAARANAGDVAPGAGLGEGIRAPLERLAHVFEDTQIDSFL